MDTPAKSPIPEHLRLWLDSQIEQGIDRPDRCTVISDPEAVSAMTHDLKIRWQSQLEGRAVQTIGPAWRRN